MSPPACPSHQAALSACDPSSAHLWRPIGSCSAPIRSPDELRQDAWKLPGAFPRCALVHRTAPSAHSLHGSGPSAALLSSEAASPPEQHLHRSSTSTHRSSTSTGAAPPHTGAAPPPTGRAQQLLHRGSTMHHWHWSHTRKRNRVSFFSSSHFSRDMMFSSAGKRCFTIESLVAKEHPLAAEEPIRPTALSYSNPATDALMNGYQAPPPAARSLYHSPDLVFPDAVNHPSLTVSPHQLGGSHLQHPHFFGTQHRDPLNFYPWVLRNRFFGHRFQGEWAGDLNIKTPGKLNLSLKGHLTYVGVWIHNNNKTLFTEVLHKHRNRNAPRHNTCS